MDQKKQQHAIVILNSQSGSLESESCHSLIEEIGKNLSASNFGADIQLVTGEDLPEAIQSACERGPSLLVVGGGDGTLLTAARIVQGREFPLGIIPLGTMNLLARDLGLPMDPLDAVEVLANGKARSIDLATVNGQVFTCSVMIGIFPRIAKKREENRFSSPFSRWWQVLTAGYRVFQNYPLFRVKVDTGSKKSEFQTRAVIISNNPFESNWKGVPPQRQRLDSGRMGIYISNTRSRIGMTFWLLQILAGAWNKSRFLAEMETDHLILDSPERNEFGAIADGELLKLATPIEFAMSRQALRVIVP